MRLFSMRKNPLGFRNGVRPLAITAAVLLTQMSNFAAEPQWARFRGPNGSGIASLPNLPIPFGEKELKWKTPLPGKGHSSPVIANGRVFVTSTPADLNKRALVALGSADGKVLWEKEWEGATFRQHADNSYTSASPAVDAERVYIWWTSPDQSWLVAVDQKDGREIWKRELGGFTSQHGAGSSPVVFEDSVILDFGQEGPEGKGSYTLCVDAKTGTTRWQTERASTSSTSSSPCIYKPKEGPAQVILMSRTSGLTGLDAKTGQKIWDLPSLIPKRCVASPVVTDSGLVIAQCGEGQAESFVYAVKPGTASTPPQKVYEVIRTGGYVPTPIATGNLLYLWKENGLVTCVKADTNEQVWSERVEGPFYGSPVLVNGHLMNITRRGDLVILKAGEKFEPIARVPLGEGSFATPAVGDGKLFVRTFTHLLAFGS
jgi:outer membrane protein assembly factor BamB